MKDGFVKVAAATPKIRVADCRENAEQVFTLIREADKQGVKVLCFPELCLTGYTCGDLFLQPTLLKGAEDALATVLSATRHLEIIAAVGLPVRYGHKLYNCAAVIQHGQILGLVPKIHLPNYSEFYEARWFTSGGQAEELVTLCGQNVLLSAKQVFPCATLPELVIGVEICEDLWVPQPPCEGLTAAGATLILNLSASDEIVCKDSYRRTLVSSTAGRLVSGYVYADAGEGESSTDLVFGAHNLICENGTILAESRFSTGLTVSELDFHKLSEERQRMSTYPAAHSEGYSSTPFSLTLTQTKLTRYIAPNPFVPADHGDRADRCEEILLLASLGLKKRLEHTHAATAVIGLSGGLDSTLAILITKIAMDMLGRPGSDIVAVTMPCFGTTDRTRDNACLLADCLGATLRRIDIGKAVTQHFKDIGQSMDDHSVTFENGQARERTQVLMDIANKTGGMVVGTGDLSELALGWATYNGDHMSMYAVNASIPKTLVRHLVRFVAEDKANKEPELSAVLLDILDTPVSPELLPAENGTISQKTEDLVGPYELHDFFLYYGIRFGFPPVKVFRLAEHALGDTYDRATILKWLMTFYRRFFAQQFKRSCLPDGPKVGSVTLSPRGDWRMPSDAVANLWLSQLEELQKQLPQPL
jgi:NAD+ synthase (glutamine-hydrolysing)